MHMTTGIQHVTVHSTWQQHETTSALTGLYLLDDVGLEADRVDGAGADVAAPQLLQFVVQLPL